MVFLKIQYQHSCYIERKKKLKCLSIWWGERKNENVRVRQKENLEKALFDWFKGMQMNNLPISGTILREKATSYAQKLQVEEFHASNGWFESWKARFSVSFKAILGEEKAVTPETTSSWWELHLPTILAWFELKDILKLLIIIIMLMNLDFLSRITYNDNWS